MQDTVGIAWWQLAILLALSAYAAMQLLALPLLRAYIYRSSRATEQSLADKLDFGLPDYALASRKLWLDRLANDPGVRDAIEKTAAGTGSSVSAVTAKARVYAEEIVPAFNVLIYFRFGYWLARIFLRMYYWIRVVHSEPGEYDRIPRDSLVVLVSNHRSNFDPLLLIYMASRRAPISYSAGEWALSFPFRQLLHAIGFYVIRRDGMKDELYRRVLERYVFLAASQCVPQGLFLEGSLSRDGKLQPLKFGILNYLLKSLGQGNCRDIVFVPAALNYDKIPEDRTLLAHRDDGFADKGSFYSLLSFLRFFATVVTYVMPRRRKPFGYACVNFGAPVSLRQWQRTRGLDLGALDGTARREAIAALGHDLAARVQCLIPVLPTNVLAQVLADCEQFPIAEIELKLRALGMLREMAARSVPVVLPDNDEDFALSQGIYVLLRRKVIRPSGVGGFEPVEANRDLLDYYRDTVAHHMN